MKQQSLHALKKNKNLDLDQYLPYIYDFQMYSIELFDFGDKNIFNHKKQDESIIYDDGIKKRSYLTEF